jgi:hypothetical protein
MRESTTDSAPPRRSSKVLRFQDSVLTTQVCQSSWQALRLNCLRWWDVDAVILSHDASGCRAALHRCIAEHFYLHSYLIIASYPQELPLPIGTNAESDGVVLTTRSSRRHGPAAGQRAMRKISQLSTPACATRRTCRLSFIAQIVLANGIRNNLSGCDKATPLIRTWVRH